jgi:hypothetical protein
MVSFIRLVTTMAIIQKCSTTIKNASKRPMARSLYLQKGLIENVYDQRSRNYVEDGPNPQGRSGANAWFG